MAAVEDAQGARPDAASDRIRVEAERLAADTARMRSRLGPGDAPDLREALIAIEADARR